MSAHEHAASTAQSFQYLTFYCGKELFGLAVEAVKQIIEPDSMTRIPGAASYIRGVIEVNDDVIPIIDLPMKVGATVHGQARRSCVVLARVPQESKEATIGLWVTEVREIVAVEAKNIRSTPSVHEEAGDKDYVGSLVHTDDGLVVLIDPQQVLTAEEFSHTRQLQQDYSVDQ